MYSVYLSLYLLFIIKNSLLLVVTTYPVPGEITGVLEWGYFLSSFSVFDDILSLPSTDSLENQGYCWNVIVPWQKRDKNVVRIGFVLLVINTNVVLHLMSPVSTRDYYSQCNPTSIVRFSSTPQFAIHYTSGGIVHVRYTERVSGWEQ